MKLVNGKETTILFIFEVAGAIFTSLFLAAYLSGLPSTKVLHSEPLFRIPLIIFGICFLGIALLLLIFAAFGKRDNIVVPIS